MFLFLFLFCFVLAWLVFETCRVHSPGTRCADQGGPELGVVLLPLPFTHVTRQACVRVLFESETSKPKTGIAGLKADALLAVHSTTML